MDVDWQTSRAIFCLTNSLLAYLNGEVAKRFPGTFSLYRSADSVSCESLEAQSKAELQYPQELLNSIEGSASFPDHEIKLKKGLIVIILRNIKPCFGHVNGTRYLVERISANFLFLTSVFCSKKGTRLTLPRMICSVPADDFPIAGFRRRQFPVGVCFCNDNQKTSRTVHY